MNKRFKKILSFVILVIIIVFFILYVSKHFQEFKQLKIVSPFSIVLLLTFFIFDLFISGLVIKFTLVPFNVRINTKEAFGISTISRFYNFIMPFKSGTMARALYLKKKHNFSYANFIAATSSVYIMIFLIGSIAGVFSMILIWYSYGLFNLLIFILFVGSSLFLASIIIFSPKIPESKHSWINKFIKVINSWNLIKNNKRVIFLLFVSSFLHFIGFIGALIVTYNIMGIKIGLIKSTFITALSSMSALVAITPGNIGIGDAINVFSASVAGISIVAAVAAAILGRAINTIAIFILGPTYSYILFKKIKQNGKPDQTSLSE